MALFKILKGNENNLPTTKTPGYMYITEDQGNIFVDLSTTERIQLNAKTASKATSVYYGVCSTAASTAAKVLTVDDTFKLVEGAQVTIKFTNANSVASPTLNVNGTGAKEMRVYGTTDVSFDTTVTGWVAGAVQIFTYDGTAWYRDYWSNTTYTNQSSLGQGYATCSTAAATVAKAASLSSYNLTTGGVVAVEFTYAVPASATLNVNRKGAKPIYYKGAAIKAGVIKAGDIATFMYNGSQYHLLAIDRWQDDIATNTDNKVTNTLNTTTKAYITGTTSDTTNTGTQIFDTGVYLDTTAGTLTATKFNGPLANSLSIFGSTYNGSSAVTIGATGVTAGTYGPSSNVTGNNAVTLTVPQITVDTYGRVTSVTNRTYTSVNTDTNDDSKVQTTKKTSGTGYVTTCTGAGTAGLSYHTSVYVNHSTGVLMGAAWNDYAEYRETKTEIEPGRVVIETGNGDLVLSQERMAPAPNVVSDTFGFAIGQTEKCNTPIAIAGRALVYPFEDRGNFKAGDVVCAGPEGTVSLMTREEIKEYPDRILGIVSEIPNYETWGETNIKVNNRIWIKIK